MTLRDLLKKKDKIEERNVAQPQMVQPGNLEPPPPFKIYRSDTNTEELISPPSFASEKDASAAGASNTPQSPPSRSPLGRLSSLSRSSERGSSPQKEHKRLSQRLHLKSRSSSTNSSNLPSNLPDIQDAYSPRGDQEEKEAVWEERATILAASPRPTTPIASADGAAEMSQLSIDEHRGRPRSISDAQSDVNIQNAIRLHEEGRLEEAAGMFKQLADRGNVLSEVLYGLSLRHGWGIPKDEPRAFTYLSSAASNSATLESEALKAGLKKGGAAKGELVLAIFELGNCYRNGWGTPVDKAAARQYYETAANLGELHPYCRGRG